MIPERLTRRIFLRLLFGLGLISLSWPNWIFARTCRQSASDPLVFKLTSVSCKKSAAVVGKEYLESYPQEADTKKLVELLCGGDNEKFAKYRNADRQVLRKLLRTQQQMDFQEGRTVKVQGWILSSTEARLCGLVALQ